MNTEQFKFLLVGGTNTLLGFSVFAVLETLTRRIGILNEQPALASVLVLTTSHLIVSIPAFYLYKLFVFKVRGTFWKQFFRFQSIYVFPLSLNILALPTLVQLGMNAIYAQGVIMTLNIVISFMGHKYFSFRKTE